MALSNKNRESHQVAESLPDPSEETKKESTAEVLDDTFTIQIDHNYINGVSPMLDIVKTDEN